ncbi:hypothetical protein [uncultured Jatrophihabitans sp.]|uniref:hypothetical protein n=1 Tax=uncultured Jatrophihabitans sp. TaxID=1610747 RepID=UPI0035CA7C8B
MTLFTSRGLVVTATSVVAVAVLSGCTSNGNGPHIDNGQATNGTSVPRSESQEAAADPGGAAIPGSSPSTASVPPVPCSAASAGVVAEVLAHLTGSARALGPARSLATTQADQDSSGWPTTVVGAALTRLPGSPVGVWAVAAVGTTPRILALNGAAERYTVRQAAVSTTLQAQLRNGMAASNAAFCVRNGT